MQAPTDDLVFEIFQAVDFETCGQLNLCIADEQLVEACGGDIGHCRNQEQINDLNDCKCHDLGGFGRIITRAHELCSPAVTMRTMPINTVPAVRSTHPITGTIRR